MVEAVGGVGLQGHLRRCAAGSGCVELPAAGFVEALAGAAVAGGEPGDVEPGMVGEQLDEALPDGSGGTENADIAPFHPPSLSQGDGADG